MLTGMFAVFATQNITSLVSSSLDDKLRSQLVSESQRLSDGFAKQERNHLEVIRAIAFTQGLDEAVAARDSARLAALAAPQVANSRTERVEIFDAAGLRLFGVGTASDGSPMALPGGQAPADWTTVSAAIMGRADALGDKWAQLATSPEGAVLLTAGPIFDDSGTVIGAVAVSTQLRSLLLDARRTGIGEFSAFTTNGDLLASTFDPGDATDENGFFRGRSRGSTGLSGDGTVTGREYAFLNGDLRLRGSVVGGFATAISREGVSTASNSTRLRMSLIFSAITLAVVLIGWAIARSLTFPLGRLVTAARSVSDGDLSARSHVRTGDEIGLLGASFDAMAERLERQHIATIGALASAIDARDPYTAGHSIRVGDLSFELGREMGLAPVSLHHLRVGGLLHDIGKIGIRDTVLLKPGKLNDEERNLIEQHPTIGLRILEWAELPKEVLEIVGGHHERIDGSGYPLGLHGDDLSIFPRITAVADMYDAITTDRPYRRGLSPQEALRTLWREAEGGIIDPEVVGTLRRFARHWEARRPNQPAQTFGWVESLEFLRANGGNVA
ncbi:MAG: HD domain-containing protein [Dehalococcoidia bacterium]|nr:HD domain-containing protein [Dehalococcoidia bacterium]